MQLVLQVSRCTLNRLSALATSTGLSVEGVAALLLEIGIRSPTRAFDLAVGRVLSKNRELYDRLARK